jgi:hypothetical protein
MSMKAQAQMMQQAQQAMQGQGGGKRQPQPGSQPAMPRQGRQPPGRIAPDQLNASPGVIQMPRRM